MEKSQKNQTKKTKNTKNTKKTLENKPPRCPKGFFRDKTGNCVAKPDNKANKNAEKKETPTKKTRKIGPKEKAAKVLKERRECIQRFREKLE
jgi:hypothetical protein